MWRVSLWQTNLCRRRRLGDAKDVESFWLAHRHVATAVAIQMTAQRVCVKVVVEVVLKISGIEFDLVVAFAMF